MTLVTPTGSSRFPGSFQPDPHLRALMDSVNDGVAFFAPDLRYILLNTAHAHANGLNVSAHLGRTPGELLPSLALPLERALRRALDSRQGHATRVTGETPAQPGVVRTWQVALTPVYDGSDVLAGVCAVFEDVEEQGAGGVRDSRSTVSALAAQLYSVVIGLTGAQTVREVVRVILTQGFPVTGAFVGGVSQLEPDGQHLRVLGTVGYDDATVSAWPLVPLHLPIPVSTAIRERSPLFLTPTDLQREFPELAQTPLYANQARVALPLTVGDRVIGALDFGFSPRGPFSVSERDSLLALADACAHVLANVQQLERDRDAHQELGRASAILNTMYEHAPVGFALIDAKMQVLRVNPAFTRMAGKSADQLIGRKVTRELAEWPQLALAVGQVRETRETMTGLVLRRAFEGAEVQFLASCYPVLTPSEGLIGVGCVVSEVHAAS